MIPLIGIMIGFYIIARTLFLFIQGNTPLLVKIWYLLTILVAMLCIAYLVATRMNLHTLQKDFIEGWRKILH